MTIENLNQQPITPEAPEEKEQKDQPRTAFETKEGEKFFAERLASPEDPRVKTVQSMLEKNFGKKEVDPVEVTKEAIEEVPPYLVHVAENSKGEVVGLNTSAVVETVNARGRESEKYGVWLGCYDLVNRQERDKGVREELFKISEQAAQKDAQQRELEIRGFMTEVSGAEESFFNSVGAKRAYIKTRKGYEELPYEQPPLDWNPKTGRPAEDAGSVPEHLMLKLTSGKDKLSGRELMEMVRGMYYYNNYQDKEDFKNAKAYERHTEFVEGIEQKLADFIGRRKVHLLSREEREALAEKDAKFIHHRENEDKEEAKKLARAEKREQRKEWRKQFGVMAEVQLVIEKASREAKKEKVEVESAKIPEKPIQPEQIFEEAGLGRNYYLSELGYSMRYKGLLQDKIEVLDESGKPVKEFKSFYFSKTERQVDDFLKERLAEKLKGQPAEKPTDEKLEKGLQKTVSQAENEQVGRREKISSLADVKEVGRGRLEKIINGLSYIAAVDKLGILGFKRGKKLAVEGGKDLAALGLTPAMALEQAGLEVAVRTQIIRGSIEKRHAEDDLQLEERLKEVKEHPNAPWPVHYLELLDDLEEKSKRASDKMINGFDKLHKKGKILRLIERLKG